MCLLLLNTFPRPDVVVLAWGCVERRGGGHPNQKGFSIEQQILAVTDFGKFL
jgi:hypothetical protein